MKKLTTSFRLAVAIGAVSLLTNTGCTTHPHGDQKVDPKDRPHRVGTTHPHGDQKLDPKDRPRAVQSSAPPMDKDTTHPRG